MKQMLSAMFILVLFLIMLLFPSETLRGASDGLLLWFQILTPTLLPFLIITNLLLRTNTISYIVKLIGPLLQKIFRVSPAASFAVLAGFLCGYPIGAKVTADMVKRGQININEGNYLLSFCNHTSPAFIAGYMVLQHLGDPALLFPSIFILYTSSFLCSLLFRKYHKTGSDINDYNKSNRTYFHFQLIDDSIMNAFETLTKIGGYIILFSICFILGQHLPIRAFLPLLEITNGIPYILTLTNNFLWQYVYIMALASFGGICSIAQTYSVIQGSNLSITFYTIEKLITALVTSLLSFLYVMISLR